MVFRRYFHIHINPGSNYLLFPFTFYKIPTASIHVVVNSIFGKCEKKRSPETERKYFSSKWNSSSSSRSEYVLNRNSLTDLLVILGNNFHAANYNTFWQITFRCLHSGSERHEWASKPNGKHIQTTSTSKFHWKSFIYISTP